MSYAPRRTGRMTRDDFQRAFWQANHKGILANVAWTDVKRIAEMIEDRQGWAPEPPSERDLRAWLGLGPVPFQDIDLTRALKHARNHSVHVTLDSIADHRWSIIHNGKMYDCASLRIVARTVTALAYAEYHRGADVSRLLGGVT